MDSQRERCARLVPQLCDALLNTMRDGTLPHWQTLYAVTSAWSLAGWHLEDMEIRELRGLAADLKRGPAWVDPQTLYTVIVDVRTAAVNLYEGEQEALRL